MQKAIFIDRDGTIGGTDKVVYPGEFALFPFVRESIVKLKSLGYLIVSFTNQPGISKGEAVKADFEAELTKFGFDKVYLCPHQHHEACSCRKPATGMLLQAAKENNLNLRECVVIGDRWTDMLAANEVKATKILVKTGAGKDAYEKFKAEVYYGKYDEVCPEYVATDFSDATDWILSNLR